MPGMIEAVSALEWCAGTAYAVYWANANATCGAAGTGADWVIQGVVCNYEHAVEYIRQLYLQGT